MKTLLAVAARSADGGKPLQAGQDDIVLAAGAVNDQRLAALVRADEYAHMAVTGVKHQIAGQGFAPRDWGAVAVLAGSAAAVTDDVAQRVVEYPVHKAGTIQAEGAHGSGGSAAGRSHFCGRTPALVPANGAAFCIFRRNSPACTDF